MNHVNREGVARRKFIDRAWQSFINDGVVNERLSDHVIRSWRRSRDTFGISPALRRCPRLLTPAELTHRQTSDDTNQLARPILDEFGARLASTQQVLTFFDAAGWMLSIGGNPGTIERLAEINFCPGANWHEDSTGTNGPGLAFADKRPQEVFASEHFVEAWQGWTCAAAPVLGPGTTDLLGVVDITGPWSAGDVQGLVAARAIAMAIEERVRASEVVRTQVLEYAFRAAPGNCDGLFAIDRHGRAIAANDAARRRLSIEGLEIPASVQGLLVSRLHQGLAPLPDLAVDWPGGPTNVRLVVSPVRYGQGPIGALVRVVAAESPKTRGAAKAPASPARMAVARYTFDHVLGKAESILRATALARMAARNDLPVVLTGESGTGKEMIAQAIHLASERSAGPFIAVNCGSIPAALLEAELFGYEAGTFTGARREGNAGKFEEACGGTLFLDEVGELSPQAQTALLRVLQEHEVVRLGGSTPRRLDGRVIAASNKSLTDETRAGRFRSDLFFRLNVLSIVAPPLRERRSDVPLLAQAFLREAEGEVRKPGLRFTDEALRALSLFDWPGNIRELRNVVMRVASMATENGIDVADLPEEVRAAVTPGLGPARVPEEEQAPIPPLSRRSATVDRDREGLLRALQASGGNVAHTAAALNVSRMTLYRWLHGHGLTRFEYGRRS
jgi:transcriptional regulator of acetoin/glycerol metabolism